MNLLPFIGFYWRRNKQIAELFAGKVGTDSHVIVDVLRANAPFIKKYFPALDKDGLFDDFLNTLKEACAPPEDPPDRAQGIN